MAVTIPFSTVATSSLLDFHVTFLFVALSGFTVATNVNFSSTFSVFSVWFRVTPVTNIVSASPSVVNDKLIPLLNSSLKSSNVIGNASPSPGLCRFKAMYFVLLSVSIVSLLCKTFEFIKL